MLKPLLALLHAPVYRRRLEVLTELIVPHLRDGDRVLDVGCGAGTMAVALKVQALADGRSVSMEGLERFPRGGEPIPVTPYDGGQIPFADDSFDVVIVADVLHHEGNPEMLLRECIRVSRRHVIIKDHQLSGPLAQARVSLIDWAANAPYGVECLYRYNSPREWGAILRGLQLTPVALFRAINLYPAGFNFLFGRRLQYLAVCEVPGNQAAAP
ncbi:MAG: methyltransferase domain-containing protein [Verrucomicrobiota bacterium]|nr:methyltransferase domain-containing protein [Verrucomicrobiota bacterium]